jgi:hypothetical protein
MCDCEFWGENRADEYFMDVGCVLGHFVCSSKCSEYQKIKSEK